MNKNTVAKHISDDGKKTSYRIHCPACKNSHVFDERWTFDGNYETPTFSPSMLVHEDKTWRENSNDKHGHRCHSYVRKGVMEFLSDCTHSMKNTRVELEEINTVKRGEQSA